MNVDVVTLVRRAAAAALNAQAEVAQKATRALVPTDLGGLSESIKVDTATSGDLTSRISTDLDYALYQHEALDLVHPRGQAKYMETAVAAEHSAIQSAGAAAAKRALS